MKSELIQLCISISIPTFGENVPLRASKVFLYVLRSLFCLGTFALTSTAGYFMPKLHIQGFSVLFVLLGWRPGNTRHGGGKKVA